MNIVGYKSTWLTLIMLSVMSGTVVNAQEVALKECFEIIEKNNAQDIIKWFAEHKDLIDKQDPESGMTPLYKLIEQVIDEESAKLRFFPQEKKELVNLELQLLPEADLTLVDKDGINGLGYIINSFNIVLIEAGFTYALKGKNFDELLNHQDSWGKTPFYRLVGHGFLCCDSESCSCCESESEKSSDSESEQSVESESLEVMTEPVAKTEAEKEKNKIALEILPHANLSLVDDSGMNGLRYVSLTDEASLIQAAFAQASKNKNFDELLNHQDDEGYTAYLSLLDQVKSASVISKEDEVYNRELITIALKYIHQANLFLAPKEYKEINGLYKIIFIGDIPLVVAAIRQMITDKKFAKMINYQDEYQQTLFLRLLFLLLAHNDNLELIAIVKQVLPYARLSLMNEEKHKCLTFIGWVNNPELTQMALKRYVKELEELIQEYKIDEQKDEYTYYIKPFLMFLRQLPPEMKDEARQVSGKFFEAYNFRHTAAPEDLLKVEFDGESVNDFLKHMSTKFMNDPLYLGNMLLKGIPQKRRTKISEKIVLKNKKQEKTQEPTN
jgi:hypothetical protein